MNTIPLNNLVREKALLVTYIEPELENIRGTLSNLKEIVINQPDFGAPILGGSYKRRTMVKGVSDVDVYFEYSGAGNPQSALSILKSCLSNRYPTSVIKQDKPSILADFNKIPINVTPYKKGIYGMMIPDQNLTGWEPVNMASLESSIQNVRARSEDYVHAIKVLKLWNHFHKKGIKNFSIEQSICSASVYAPLGTIAISNVIWSYLNSSGHTKDAATWHSLKTSAFAALNLKSLFLDFIENR